MMQLNNKYLRIWLFTLLSVFITTAYARGETVVTANINGMTCQFCAFGLQKALGKVSGIKRAQVSLARKQARITLRPGKKLDSGLVARIKGAIKNAGYTPGNVSVAR